jgi:hypothetical protein
MTGTVVAALQKQNTWAMDVTGTRAVAMIGGVPTPGRTTARLLQRS